MCDKNKELIDKHLELVLEANKVHNLTRITNKKEAQIFHIEDSLEALQEINKMPEGLLADIGSGPGYPGIPIAIYTNRHVDLVESVSKKCDCLESFINKLNISSNVFVINKRIEELSIEHPNQYTIITARALSSLSSLLELASPLLKTDGFLVCYKGNDINKEIPDEKKVEEKLGMKFISNRKYILSDNKTIHRILVYKKINTATIKLPRKIGFAQKKPILSF